ncbi:multidrug effflux MFS transporter [Sandaracinobacter sp. RS1-74]|uniref:multidrug effflux MFS transporter n=1 Tax=Sandaracinobacteroides sayramensis TaxID=2913411 RepID=UPI001EDC4BFA|nr:multidrug effflux MFS transporter [Sandaracinobacteroides sayramensis]MCG2840177.1 multidrug effflux MFS transporter [Sandaracinobacteroides sayramensis]
MTTDILSRPAPLRIAVGLGLITLLGPASVDMYLPSIPVMADDLAIPYTTMQLTLTVFLLAMGGGQLVFGPVIDALGRRRPLLAAIALFVATSLWAASAQSVESLIAARFLQGLAASLALVTAMSSVRDVAEGVRAAQLFALLMTIQGLGPVLAPAVGGVIGEAFGWRGVFLALAALGVGVAANTLANLPESLAHDKRSSLNLSAVMRTYAGIVSDRRFMLPGLALAAVFFFLFAYIGGASYAYQTGYGLSPRDFGFVFGATGTAVLIGAMASAKLVTRLRIEALALAGALAMLAGALIGLFSALGGVGLPGIVTGMFLALAGLGIAEATLMSVALATRTTALGASAALLGAFPLLLGAAATPVAAMVAEIGAAHWLGLLAATGLAASGLAFTTARMVSRHGLQVGLQHG